MAQPNAPQSLWLRWKSLKLPWRRQRLVGQDLSGVTFWEAHNPNVPARPRRIAVPPQGRQNLIQAADLQLSPAWLQWLRHTRPIAPTMEEQQLEVQRQAQLKQLAAAADARWESKPRLSDSPEATGQLQPSPLLPKDDLARSSDATVQGEKDDQGPLGANANVVKDQVDERGTPTEPQATKQSTRQEPSDRKNPWARHKTNPGDEWQPAAWNPTKEQKR